MRKPPQRKKVLIVNASFNELRGAATRPLAAPQAMGPAYLAGAFAAAKCEIRLYNETASGPLHDRDLLAWPDMLVLTSLTSGLDRMLHLTAYARTLNPGVVVVAGGPAIRALPEYTAPFFDYACQGDIEELQQVIAEVFGSGYSAEEMVPRFDLAYWNGFIGHVESTRNCNFRCSFCSIAGEGRRYRKYPLDAIRKQILAMGRKKVLFFIDQNFYGNDRRYFFERLELLRELRAAGCFKHWTALVTNDFFLNDDNLAAARASGCVALFSGVESFDTAWLRGMNKLQNTHAGATELIRKCLNAGIVFLYGLMLDVTTRPVRELRDELDYITSTTEITLPGFLTVPIPIPGTRYFDECLSSGRILPNTRLRDLDGATLSLRPVDPLAAAARFVGDSQTMRGYGARILRHSAGFVRRYWKTLSHLQLGVALSGAVLTALPKVLSRNNGSGVQRTYLTSTEPLDPLYHPALPVASRYERYFRPTMVTGPDGALSEDLRELAAQSCVAVG